MSAQQPYCAAGQMAAFTFGFQALSDALGARMGEPTECAHADVASGDTYQQTTKGLAIYRRAANAPTFASGASHWSLTGDGLIESSTASGQAADVRTS